MSEQAHEPFPEHEKMKALGERKDEIQSFIDWLIDEQEICLAMWGRPAWGGGGREGRLKDESHLYNLEMAEHPLTLTFRGRGMREKLMAAYFGIDLDKISNEKDEMLAALRAMNS